MIDVGDYVGFVGREYLHGYVDAGGAAVKFAVCSDDATADSCIEQLTAAARQAGYAVALVDAAITRMHLLEQVFFDVAGQVDWDALAAEATRAAATAAGYPPAGDGAVALDQLAAHHRVDARELRRDIDRALQQQVHRDYAMVSEFRTAMLRLCQAQLRAGQVSEAEHAAVLDWLHGNLRQISALKSALIFRRIGRHNARLLLFSLAHWLAVNGHAGLVLVLDVRRFGFARRPSPEERHGHYYTRAALIDAYEVLRQLVDNTDELANCFVAVVTSPAFVTDTGRGLDAYEALKLRVFDEVRDKERDNPFSSLLRLGAS
ncbi:MAG: ATP-binding protein [Actinomycetota bacterium]|nr:ATP-binding protein [Actinomycetota bacterium]